VLQFLDFLAELFLEFFDHVATTGDKKREAPDWLKPGAGGHLKAPSLYVSLRSESRPRAAAA
jgi:hypothetical protein